jgi:hypothetical protein
MLKTLSLINDFGGDCKTQGFIAWRGSWRALDTGWYFTYTANKPLWTFFNTLIFVCKVSTFSTLKISGVSSSSIWAGNNTSVRVRIKIVEYFLMNSARRAKTWIFTARYTAILARLAKIIIKISEIAQWTWYLTSVFGWLLEIESDIAWRGS